MFQHRTGREVPTGRRHRAALARRGVIELQPSTSRGIRLLEAAEDELLLPVVGRVAAGSPILAEEHIEDHHRLDPSLFRPRAHYLLRVRGSSMRDLISASIAAITRYSAASSRRRSFIISMYWIY